MSSQRAPRNTLTRERVVAGAVDLADRAGLEALTIRALADHLGVRPMAIYHHVANKDAILDAVVDVVYGEIYRPSTRGPWREELAKRARSMRAALTRHPWALALMDTRANPGPANLANHEALLDVLLSAGFSMSATAHAVAVVEAFVYGFALQEKMLGAVGLEDSTEELMVGMDLAVVPRMAEFAARHVAAAGYAFGDSFEVGLTIVLDGVARLAPTCE